MKINLILILTNRVFISQILGKHCYVSGTGLGTQDRMISKQQVVPAHP